MKKIIALMLCFVMLISLIACSTDGDDASTATTTTTAPTTTIGADTGKLAYTEWDKEGYHIYVSENGFDYNDGTTPDKAVKSIYRANELANDYVNSSSADRQDVIISFEKGHYFISSTVRMPSGTKDIGIYYTSRGGRASFVGGLNIMPEEIMKCTDSEILNKIFDETARENLYVIDLTGYTPYLTDLLATQVKENGKNIYDTVEFYAGDYNLQPSRFPEEDQQVSDNTAMGLEMPGAFAIPHINYMKDGEFVSIADIGSEFAITPVNVFIRGETYERVKSWDVENEKIYVENTLEYNYRVERHYITGFTDAPDGERYTFNGGRSYFDGYVTLHTGRTANGAVGSEYDGGEQSSCRRAYFFNILEEINDPGEYYYDEADKKLYVYLDETMPTDDLYIATLRDDAFNLEGTADDLIENIHFVNVEFKYSQTDWMRIANATNISMTGCVMGLNAGLAVFTENATDLTFKDSVFEALGTGVFYFNNTAWGDLDNDGVFDLANVLVENCIIHDITEQYVPARTAFKAKYFSGLTVRNCTVSDGGHSAVTFSDSSNLLFEYNEWSDFMTETDDGGLCYSGQHELTTMTGIVWRYNLIHDIGSSWQAWGVRLLYGDGGSGLYTVHDNIIYNFMSGDGAGTLFHNVHGADIYNNIIVNTGDNVNLLSEYLYEDNITWNLRSLRSDTHNPGNEYVYFVKFEGEDGEDEKGLTAARRELYSSDLLDDDFDFLFDRIDYLRSDKFFYDMFSRGYAVLNNVNAGSIIPSSYKSAHNNGTVTVDGETISGFEIKLTNKVGDKGAGSYDNFKSVDEMTEFMVSLGYKGKDDLSGLPEGVSMLYNGQRVYKFYFNLLAANSPEAIDEWVLSDAANEAKKTDSTVTNDIDTLFSQEKGWAHCVYRSAIYSKLAYTGLYHNNLTINAATDLSTKLEYNGKTVYWDSIHTKSYSYTDYDGIDIEVLDENGEYTTNFVDTVEDILYSDPNLLFGNDGEPVLKLLDLSKVGARLDVK